LRTCAALMRVMQSIASVGSALYVNSTSKSAPTIVSCIPCMEVVSSAMAVDDGERGKLLYIAGGDESPRVHWLCKSVSGQRRSGQSCVVVCVMLAAWSWWWSALFVVGSLGRIAIICCQTRPNARWRVSRVPAIADPTRHPRPAISCTLSILAFCQARRDTLFHISSDTRISTHGR
jgi:hypothetical protein